MFVEYAPLEAPVLPAHGAMQIERRRGGALAPKLILAVFVFALAFDLISRVTLALLARALRRLFPVTARHRPHTA